MVRFYIQKGTHRGLFRSVQKTLKFFQTFALLEVNLKHKFALLDAAYHRKTHF